MSQFLDITTGKLCEFEQEEFLEKVNTKTEEQPIDENETEIEKELRLNQAYEQDRLRQS